MYALTAKAMRYMDEYTIGNGIPSAVLMENAAGGLVDEIISRFPDKATEVLVGKLPGKTKLPKTGETIAYPCGERQLQLTRLPSTSRAYPLSLAKKAEAYRCFFQAAGLVE